MTNFFRILPIHYSFDEIEAFSVEKLAEVYPLYINDLPYVAQYEADLIKGLQILKNSDFDELWRNDILPILNRQCDEALNNCDNEMINAILLDISLVHQNKMHDDIYIHQFTKKGIKVALNSVIKRFRSPKNIKIIKKCFRINVVFGTRDETP